MTEIERRVAAVTATRTQFRGKSFAWGRVDCAKLLAFHLRQMGHKGGVGMSKAGSYRSALSARRALARAGYASLPDALDQLGFTRIPSAAALPGDIVRLPGEEGLDCMAIVVGNGRVFGFHQDTVGAEVLEPSSAMAAWRI